MRDASLHLDFNQVVENFILSVLLLFFDFEGFDAFMVVFLVKIFKLFEYEDTFLVWVYFNEQVTDHIIF